MKAAFLPDRGVVKLTGDDARGFLNNLVTSEIEMVSAENARFGALLTPQGKIIADFLICAIPAADGGGLLLDCSRELAAPLARKLGFYKLRAKVTVEDLSDTMAVVAIWDGTPALSQGIAVVDPRAPGLGWRLVVAASEPAATIAALGADLVDEAAYEAHRIAAGVPKGGTDFQYNDAFPHEANMDRLRGVDFDKGCFIGQEVVSRMQHRGTARTRVIRVSTDGAAPAAGTEIRAGGKPVGTMGSSVDGSGLALVRIDRVADALDAGHPLLAGDSPIRIVSPDDVRIATKDTPGA